MITYKHYSFDMWLTLIRSNPQFKQERARYFYHRYNNLQKPLEEIERIFRQVDLLCTGVNEATGKNIDADELYLMSIGLINEGQIALHEIDMETLFADMDELLFEYLPILYSDDTAQVLAQLKQPGVTMSILSNTGFVKGSSLRKVIQKLGIAQYFDFQLYSDEAGLYKPNKAFFELMLSKIAAIRDITLQDIIHIGDNPQTDVYGAGQVGINGMLVNSNNTGINKLITHATSHVLAT